MIFDKYLMLDSAKATYQRVYSFADVALRFAAVALLSCLALSVLAADKPAKGGSKNYVEGKHYTLVRGASKPTAGTKVVVEEVFWYGCGHCYSFEPIIKEWKKTKADYIDFRGSPAMWEQRRPGLPKDMMWTHAKLYYAASAMQELGKLHPVFFDAMHKQNKRLVKIEEIEQLVSSTGLDGKNFIGVMESFAVRSQVEQSLKRQRKYRITGTPELIVGGYYHISGRTAGSQKEMLAVADYLAKKIHDGK